MSIEQKEVYYQGYNDAFHGKDNEKDIANSLKPYYRSGQEEFIKDFMQEYDDGETVRAED